MGIKRDIIAILFFGLTMSSNAQVPEMSPVKIICIGDSITQGGNLNREDEYTYRLPLYRLIKKRGFNVDFIGVRKHGVDETFRWPSDFDADHEGFYGATTDEVRHALKIDLLELPPPDIALIHLGSNDVGNDVETAVINPLTDIIFQLRVRNPKVNIIIMQIPGMFTNLYMHFQIWRMVRELNQSISPISTIPLYWGWDTDNDTFDGAHPNIRGQEKIAVAIFSKLEPFLAMKQRL
jgi:lysophospholipase L1-like esterase